MPDPAYRPRGGAHLRESLYREEGGQRLPPEAPALSAQRPAGEQDRDGGRRGPHLRRDARGLRRGRRDGGPRASGHEDFHDLDDGGPCRRRERSPPERRREAPDALADRDRTREEALGLKGHLFPDPRGVFESMGETDRLLEGIRGRNATPTGPESPVGPQTQT